MKNTYPGLFAALFLVLLRIGIGWHFLYEGLYKVKSLGTPQQFTSEGYLRVAGGPLGEAFRAMIPDVYGLERLDLAKLKENWVNRQAAFAGHFGFDEAQRAEAAKVTEATIAKATDWFGDPNNQLTITRYKGDLAKILATESDAKALWFQQNAAREARAQADGVRRQLLASVDGWTRELEEGWTRLATPEQLADQGEYTKWWKVSEWSVLDWADYSTMFGLTAVGFCLMAGLLTPLALWGAIGLLTMFYLSAPPFPGAPLNPMSEGHYLYVNKNLIELIACLVLLCFPTGRWAGLDAVIFRKKVKAAGSTAATATQDPPTRAGAFDMDATQIDYESPNR